MQAVRSAVQGWSAGFPFQPLVIGLLWFLAALPLLLMLAAAGSYAFLTRQASSVKNALVLSGAKALGRVALPALVRKAAFGADRGRFVELRDFPPQVAAHEALSDTLREEVSAIGRQLGRDAGRAVIDAIGSNDAFSIKTQVRRALTDKALAHSHYYRAEEIKARIAELIAAQSNRPVQGASLKSTDR